MKNTGILLHISSLPNKYGIGTLGKQAYSFIDFLKKANQQIWQILPIGPTSYGDSPYQSFSSFAANPYFIDLEMLVEMGLLTNIDLKNSGLIDNSSTIDYGSIYKNKMEILKLAYFNHFMLQKEFDEFKNEQKYWLDDYALFMALKEKNNNVSWDLWPDEYKNKDEYALEKFYKLNYQLVDTYKFMQFLFSYQWVKLKKYASDNNISIMGDMPIYMAYDSCDVWSNPKNYLLDENKNPTVVAGVPPDYFSATGQLWGNPIYNYAHMKKDNYSWWVKRIKRSFELFDMLRIDHFRGFSAYYCIPNGEKTAINGVWKKGPGKSLFKVINKELNNPSIIAENLGLLDDDVVDLIKYCKYPGMRILQFEMYSKENIKELKKISKNNVIYPGTHDNDTFAGWYEKTASEVEKKNVIKELKLVNQKFSSYKLLKYLYSLPFDYLIISMQDILALNSDARLNTPGTASNNWTYRFKQNNFNDKIAYKISKIKNNF